VVSTPLAREIVQKGNHVLPHHQHLDGSHSGNDQKVHRPSRYSPLDPGIVQGVDPYLFHDPPHTEGHTEAEKESPLPKRQGLTRTFIEA
jgi:hypothetical protein